MTNDLYSVLLAQSRQSLQLSHDYARDFLQKGNFRPAVMNLSMAVADSVCAAFTEWRLGSGDPSPHLRDAVSDARELVRCFEKCPAIPYLDALWDAIYAQILLGESVDLELRRLCFVSPEERRSPTRFKQAWGYPWDMLVFTLIETAEVAPECDDFIAWLKHKGGGSNMIKTMQAYRLLIDSAKADDPKSAAKAIATAEKCFRARRNLPLTWGGDGLDDRSADHRLACVIKKAEQIRPGITAGIDTPHRWRWS
jgi:hypothetical protein